MPCRCVPAGATPGHFAGWRWPGRSPTAVRSPDWRLARDTGGARFRGRRRRSAGGPAGRAAFFRGAKLPGSPTERFQPTAEPTAATIGREAAPHVRWIGGSRMVFGQLRETLLDRLPQPKTKGHRPAGEVALQLARGLDVGFLNHVRRIDAGGSDGPIRCLATPSKYRRWRSKRRSNASGRPAAISPSSCRVWVESVIGVSRMPSIYNCGNTAMNCGNSLNLFDQTGENWRQAKWRTPAGTPTKREEIAGHREMAA